MRTFCAGVLLLVACKSGMGDDYGVTPPGGMTPPGGSNSGSDGGDGNGDGGAGTMISGRVCLLTDARDLASCSATGVANVQITLGTSAPVGVTDGAGHFTIVQPEGANLIWKVEGGDIVTSYVLLAESHNIPVITRAKLDAMKAPMGLDLQTLGSIIAQVTQNGTGVVGVTATTPPAKYLLYDGDSDILWQNQATQAAGAIWFAGVTAATGATITLVPPPMHAPPALPVHTDAITFTTIKL